VSIDHEKASYDMTKYLIDHHAKSIALLRSGYSDDMFINDQLKGYKRALKENNLEFDRSLIYEGVFRIEKAYEIIEKMIEEDLVPDAMFKL
jgi:LacI family transcriptional regulator